MNYATNDTSNPVLVAPRPVNLSSVHHVIRSCINHDPPADGESSSPRSSPRSGLSTEALEEFLSILKPPFFPPTSPVLRARRQGVTSLPTFQHERSLSIKARGRFEVIPSNGEGAEEPDMPRPQESSRVTPSITPESVKDADGSPDLDSESYPFRWFKSNLLSSPISRTHTRNPFLRHAHAQSPGLPSSLSPAAVTLSPASIPLPLPTPDEVLEIS